MNIILKYFLTAVALMLVIEGIMPFLSPARWRQMMFRLATFQDRALRIMGFLLMMAVVLLLYLIHLSTIFRS